MDHLQNLGDGVSSVENGMLGPIRPTHDVATLREFSLRDHVFLSFFIRKTGVPR